jgi:hypothetical protein
VVQGVDESITFRNRPVRPGVGVPLPNELPAACERLTLGPDDFYGRVDASGHRRLAQRRQRQLRAVAVDLSLLLDGMERMGVDDHFHRPIGADDEQMRGHPPSRQKGDEV